MAMPEPFPPMLACPGELPRDDAAHGYEVKWDGVRAIAHIDSGRLRLTGRNGSDFTPRYPELSALAEALSPQRMIIDGERWPSTRRDGRASSGFSRACIWPPSRWCGGG